MLDHGSKPPLRLDYEPLPLQRARVWPVIFFGMGLILLIAAATTPFLFRLHHWIMPAGIGALVGSLILFAIGDRD